MKNTILSLFVLAAFVSSCGSDSSDDNNNNPSSDNYLPLAIDNYWKYEVKTDNAVTGTDSLYIEKDTTINQNVYKKFTVDGIPNGFFSSVANGSAIRKSGTKLLLTGTTGLDLAAEFPVDIEIVDLPVFDSAAAMGTVIGTKNGSFSQTISEFPVTITYSLTATQGETLPTYTVPSADTFNDVKSVVLKLNLAVVTSIQILPGFPAVEVPILQSQDVVVSTIYYANNIGVIYATTNTAYELEDFSAVGITLPIPQSFSQTQTERMTIHQLQ